MIVRDIRVADFVANIVQENFIPPFTCMGIERNGEVIGGVVFNCFTGRDVHVSVAGKGWNSAFLAEVGHYVFNVMERERITVISEQPKVIRIAEKLGGQIEGCLRNHFGPGRDAFIVGILRNEYRY
jgi:RimJ/RimL family protein N-acetyltransferase